MQRSLQPALLAGLCALAALGCSTTKVEPIKKEDAVSAPQPTPANTASAMPGAPAAGTDDAYAPLSPTPDLDKAIADAAKSKDKKQLSDAYAARGAYRTRGDEKAGQRVKYRAALSDFRKALEANPANADAKAGKNEIEQIYTMMGRPIPTPAECDEVSRTGKYTPKDAK